MARVALVARKRGLVPTYTRTEGGVVVLTWRESQPSVADLD
jgi:hypothetical protein